VLRTFFAASIDQLFQVVNQNRRYGFVVDSSVLIPKHRIAKAYAGTRIEKAAVRQVDIMGRLFFIGLLQYLLPRCINT
jgi:hypothetical protein